MKRVYISGAITGTEDFMERFQKAEEKLKAEGYMVYNPAHANSYMPEGTTYEEYMKVSFCLLDLADTIYMLNGWKRSKEVCREIKYAMQKGKEIIFENEFEKYNPFCNIEAKMKMPLITVYDSPNDFRGKYVARLFDSVTPTDNFIVSTDIEEIRKTINAAGFLERIPRFKEDHPCIVEVWI